jgi:uncharacterized protein YwqG
MRAKRVGCLPMTDRYDDLMARREALWDECWRRMQAMRDRIRRTAPLVPVWWRSSGAVLSPDGRLSVDVEEFDEHYRRRLYCLWSEVDGTIHEMPALADGEEQVVFSADPRLCEGSPEPGLHELSELARRHLGRAAADAWLSLLSPAVRLVHAQPGDPVVAQLGGLPTLPINSWPVWQGCGPLSHVLSIDSASLALLLPSWNLPRTGRLAFFYFDGHYPGYQGSGVGSWDPSTQDGAQIVWLHPEESTPAHLTDVATPAPPGLTAFPAVALTAAPALTWPTWEHPQLQRIWEAHGLAGPEPGMIRPPVEALYQALDDGWNAAPNHQVGGHPQPVQGPVETEVELTERARRDAGATPARYPGPAAGEHTRGWHLLAQIDSDDEANMMWGDVGKLYFMIRPGDLQSRRFDQARFAWQC